MYAIDKNFMPMPVETRPDALSLDGLISWLETKPADDAYCYIDTGHCLIGQYTRERLGFEDVTVGSLRFIGLKGDGLGRYYSMPPHWNNVAAHFPHTFGAALERARAYKASQP